MNKNISQTREGSWPITTESLAKGLELGRLLHKTVLDWAKAQPEDPHVRILFAAVQYLQELLDQKTLAVSSYILLTQNLIEKNSLGDCIVEPYVERLKEETPEEKAERAANLRAMAEKLDPVKPDVVYEPKEEQGSFEKVAGTEDVAK